MPLNLGRLAPASNLFLAPLAGYTDLPFRRLIRGLGGLGLACTGLVNARSLLERNPKALKLIESGPDDRPLAVQLFGGNEQEMRDAARFVEDHGADVIDINMGCPVRKVVRVGGGSALLGDAGKAARMIRGVAEAVRVPVTVKMRLGVDAENLAAPILAPMLEEAGAAALTIHGRTRVQGYGGVVSLEGIRAVVRAVRRIPVIGNGDVVCAESAAFMMRETGCAGVSIGRAAFWNPWIFRQTTHFLREGRVPPEPPFEERVDFMRRHLDGMIEVFGEESGCCQFRKLASMYLRHTGPVAEFNRQVHRLASREKFEEILGHYLRWRGQFLDGDGRLLPQYRPSPMRASFMISVVGSAAGRHDADRK